MQKIRNNMKIYENIRKNIYIRCGSLGPWPWAHGPGSKGPIGPKGPSAHGPGPIGPKGPLGSPGETPLGSQGPQKCIFGALGPQKMNFFIRCFFKLIFNSFYWFLY